ncbi:hypothetical protein PoB_005560200 [Plakobranchus ocellatus]|uniref:Uncharacterized protein n=1 Tax=Plakobranchus ocellatus TaxID=259542 RepID=A0AAV4CC22_9GAST|nr:hypothetical protein PoB_005560200 [Plakobranchus ocellatus]
MMRCLRKEQGFTRDVGRPATAQGYIRATVIVLQKWVTVRSGHRGSGTSGTTFLGRDMATTGSRRTSALLFRKDDKESPEFARKETDRTTAHRERSVLIYQKEGSRKSS